jgi:hypothetical protein
MKILLIQSSGFTHPILPVLRHSGRLVPGKDLWEPNSYGLVYWIDMTAYPEPSRLRTLSLSSNGDGRMLWVDPDFQGVHPRSHRWHLVVFLLRPYGGPPG